MHAILGYLIADLGARFLPAPVADRAGVWLARLVFALGPPARRTLEANLARVLPHAPPEERRRLARQAFEHFAVSLIEFLRMRRLGGAELARTVEVRGRHHLEAARAAGRGVIVLSAHIGSWERGAAFLAAAGARVHVVARPHPNRWVERLFRRRRGRRGVGVLPGRPLWACAARVLRRGDWVALMGDRPARGGPPCAWAATLARRTGAVLLPAVMLREGTGRFVACFEAPLSPESCASGGYLAAMREYVTRYPGQWCAFEPTPAGGP